MMYNGGINPIYWKNMYNRLFSLPLDMKQSAFIFGPRGTGKTHWLKHHLRDTEHVYIDLLESDTFRQLKGQPEHLHQQVPENFAGWIIIDEVQRIPELLNEVHHAIEHDNKRFILTGSSARQLRKKGVNLLAGRALIYHMHPLIIQEAKDDFQLDHALTLGLLPGTFNYDQPRRYIKSYIDAYLREEVMQEGLTRNVSAFTRFLEVATYSQGNIVNSSEIAREVGIDRKVVDNYFSILNDLLLSHEINIFSKRAKRKLIQKNKFYYFDCGIYQHLRPKGILDSSNEISGIALETLFLQSLQAVIDYYDIDANIYYWRTTNGAEVDFIVYGKDCFCAFEIKHNSNITPKLIKGLKLFKEDYPECQPFLVYQGKQTQYLSNDITALPIITALKKLPQLFRTTKNKEDVVSNS